MPKQDNWNNIQNLSLTLRLNDPATITNADGTTSAGFTGVTIITNGQATSDSGGLRDLQRITVAGAPRVAKYTPQELATMIKGSSNSTGNFLLAELTAVYNEGIGGIA